MSANNQKPDDGDGNSRPLDGGREAETLVERGNVNTLDDATADINDLFLRLEPKACCRALRSKCSRLSIWGLRSRPALAWPMTSKQVKSFSPPSCRMTQVRFGSPE